MSELPSLAASIMLKGLDLSLEQVLDLLMEEIYAERGCIVFLDDYFIYRGTEKLRTVFPFSHSVVNQMLETGLGLVSFGSDLGQASHSIKLHGLRSAVACPIEDPEGRLMGILYCDNQASRDAFTQGDLDILRGVARRVAPAVEVHMRMRL